MAQFIVIASYLWMNSFIDDFEITVAVPMKTAVPLSDQEKSVKKNDHENTEHTHAGSSVSCHDSKKKAFVGIVATATTFTWNNLLPQESVRALTLSHMTALCPLVGQLASRLGGVKLHLHHTDALITAGGALVHSVDVNREDPFEQTNNWADHAAQTVNRHISSAFSFH